MMRSLAIANTAIKSGQDGLGVTANNISNSKTTGFKKQTAMFEDLMYQNFGAATATNEKYAGKNPVEVGNGSRMGSIAVDYSQGNIESTGRKTDMAIAGNGFFVVGDSEANDRLFTKRGNFQISEDYNLQTTDGQYVLGWNVNETTGELNTGSQLNPIRLGIGELSTPSKTTDMKFSGNLDISSPVGEVYGIQVPTYDKLGDRHDMDLNFVKTASDTFRYVASPADQFAASSSISDAILHTSEPVASALQKGDYTIDTVAGGVPGTVDITVNDPLGNPILTKNVNDVDQKVELTDASGEPWFTVDYVGGGSPSSATFQVSEVGDVTFDTTNGKIASMTGSGIGGEPMFSYNSLTTGQPVDVNVDINSLTAFSSASSVRMTEGNGMPAAVLNDFTIGDGGVVTGYYNDGSIKDIAQLAMGGFANESGLSRSEGGYFTPSANSGEAEIGASGVGDRGEIIAMSLENSNVDISKEFTDMINLQKLIQAGTKIFRVSDDSLNSIFGMVR